MTKFALSLRKESRCRGCCGFSICLGGIFGSDAAKWNGRRSSNCFRTPHSSYLENTAWQNYWEHGLCDIRFGFHYILARNWAEQRTDLHSRLLQFIQITHPYSRFLCLRTTSVSSYCTDTAIDYPETLRYTKQTSLTELAILIDWVFPLGIASQLQSLDLIQLNGRIMRSVLVDHSNSHIVTRRLAIRCLMIVETEKLRDDGQWPNQME